MVIFGRKSWIESADEKRALYVELAKPTDIETLRKRIYEAGEKAMKEGQRARAMALEKECKR